MVRFLAPATRGLVRKKECRGVLMDDKERHGVALPAFLTTS
jgi:hypothetical protein